MRLHLLGLWLSAAAALLVAKPLLATDKYLEILPGEKAEDTPAYRYANLTNAAAFAELDRRHVPYEKEPNDVPGVRAAIRLRGPLHGVTIHSSVPEADRGQSVFEILDARLALALDDFCRILQTHDVVEVIHFSMYRPAGTRSLKTDPFQFRHPGGLAIDVGALRKKTGELLSVIKQWSGSVGSKTCGADARKLKPRRGRELVSIVCEAADQKLFHSMLTPHFNKRHHDHLHLEIKPGIKWFLIN